MPPAGTDEPIIYILGEAPGRQEDSRGVPFVGKAGDVLRFRIPDAWNDYLRWNNVVRTRPTETKREGGKTYVTNRTPTRVEIECCRPSVSADIEATKPVAIFGFGTIPLQWVSGQSGITKWTMRRFPVKIGEHACWYYPMVHPAYVARARRFEPETVKEYGSDTEFLFAKNLQWAFREIENDILPEPEVHTIDNVEDGVEIITGDGGEHDLRQAIDFLESLDDPDLTVGYDYETKGLRPYRKGTKICSVAIATPERAVAIALDHKQAGWTKAQREELDGALEWFIYSARCRRVVHNLAFEHEWTAYHYGRKALRAQRWECTMSEAYILDERQGALSLDFLVMQYFGFQLKSLSKVDRTNIDATPIRNVLTYNAFDAKYHLHLHDAQMVRLKVEKMLTTYRWHLRRIPTMVLTQLKGVPVDQKIVNRFYKRYTKRLTKVEEQIQQLKIVARFKKETKRDFSPSKNRDVFYALKDMLHYDIESTDQKYIKPIDHPLARLILKWRGINKILSTYIKPFRVGAPNLFDDGRVHPIISTTKTRTWRTSSEDPNIQNQPKRQNKEIRSQVNPSGASKKDVDLRVVSFDYGQIQARNVGMESRDEFLVKAFWDRYEIHGDWAERIAKAYPKWVEGGPGKFNDRKIWKTYRDKAKNEWVFPNFFGAQPKALAGYLGIPLHIAERLTEEFWENFPGVRTWQKRITRQYFRDGYVTGLSGFRRHAPISPNELINAPIQADEAMIVCDAMARLSEYELDQYQASMEIHDDLTFIWPYKKIERYAETVIHEMLNVPFEWAHTVPIVVEMSVGTDWSNGEEVGNFASDQWNEKVYDEAIDAWLNDREVQKNENEATGSWDDGTSWANSRNYERPPSHKRKKVESRRALP